MAFSRKCINETKNINKNLKWYSFLICKSQQPPPRACWNCYRKDRIVTVGQKWIHTTNIINKSVAFKLSDIGEGIKEVVIKEWYVKEGDKVQQFDNICEVQSDKATVTITSRYDGTVTRLHHTVDQIALVGQPLVDFEVDDDYKDTSNTDSIATKPVTQDKTNNESGVKVLTTPAVRRIAAQFQVDLSNVNATGKNGRILKEDLLSHLNITSDNSNDIPYIDASGAASVHNEVLMEDKTVKITGFIKAMVKSMGETTKIPHFGFCDEYDVTKLVECRKDLKVIAEKQGVKLTYMPIIIKAASLCLSAYPILNSSVDNFCENITYKANHNFSVAMDTPHGLLVPVIKNVQTKSIIEIAKDLNLLQEKGAKGKLNLDDLAGGTFTISNIGIIGGTYTKPVITPPQVAIGALGKFQVLPRFDGDGNIVKCHIVEVSWSADHRVIDGVTLARFSNKLKHYVENPHKLLLDI